MRAMAEWMLNKVCGWIETTSKAEDVHARLLKTFSRLCAGSSQDAQVRSDLAAAQRMLDARAELQWWFAPARIEAVSPGESDCGPMLDEAEDWLCNLPEGKILRQRVVIRDAGRMLGLLDADVPELRGRIKGLLEQLLRHVEVNREGCLANFSPDVSEQERLLQRLDVAILFSRHAMREQDVRFLNGALKLNDWFGMGGCRHRDEVVAARGVLSLASQEACLYDFGRHEAGGFQFGEIPCVLPFSRQSKTAFTRAS